MFLPKCIQHLAKMMPENPNNVCIHIICSAQKCQSKLWATARALYPPPSPRAYPWCRCPAQLVLRRKNAQHGPANLRKKNWMCKVQVRNQKYRIRPEYQNQMCQNIAIWKYLRMLRNCVHKLLELKDCDAFHRIVSRFLRVDPEKRWKRVLSPKNRSWWSRTRASESSTEM